MLVIRFDVDATDEDVDVGNIVSESSLCTDEAIFCSVDVISVVIIRQSLRRAEAMQNKMLTNHVEMINIQDFNTDTRWKYKNIEFIRNC